MSASNYQDVLRTGLVNQGYVGHRPDLWDEQTSVTFNKPPSKTAQLYKAMDSRDPVYETYEEAIARAR
jgi:hypothetical protein